MPSRKNEKGALSLMVALLTTALLAVASLALDIGMQRVGVRDMQAVADLVALDMARLVDGRTAADITGDSSWNKTLADSKARNDDTIGEEPTVTAEVGVVDEITGAFTAVSGTSVPNGVRVSSVSTVDYVLHPGEGDIRRRAIATAESTACFALGSYAARVKAGDSSLLGPILGAIDSDLQLGLVSYQGLANLDVDLASVAAELDAGTVDELAGTTVSVADFYVAIAHVLQDDGHSAEATLLQSLALKIVSLPDVQIGDILGLTSSGEGALDATFNVLDLVTGAAFVANGENAVAVPSLGLSIPGLTSLTGELRVIEALKPVCARKNEVGKTATSTQVALELGGTLASLPNVLGLTATSAGLDLDLEVAKAVGVLMEITCGQAVTESDPEGIGVDVSTGLTEIDLGVPIRVQGNISLVGLGLVNVDIVLRASSSVDSADNTERVDYMVPPMNYGDAKETVNGGLGLPNASLSVVSVSAKVLGLPITLPAANLTTIVNGVMSGIVTPVINPLIGRINNLLLGPLAETLGLRLGGADLYLYPRPSCSSPALRG